MDLARRLGGNELYDCRSCAANPALFEQLGHDGPPTNYWRENLLSGEPLQRCPVRELLALRETDPRALTEFEQHVGTYWPAYKAGHLLVAGGIADQPARYVDMMHAIADVVERSDDKYLELTKPPEAD